LPRSFPFEAVRDLIGVLRAMYAAERGQLHPSRRQLAAIHGIATELQAAIRTAAPHDPGTAPYERAITMADTAVARLGTVLEDRVGARPDLERVVSAAAQRIRSLRRTPGPTEREIKWAVGKKRG
jgi:hypothetical protein